MESLPVLPSQGQSEDKNTCLENTHHISSWYQIEVPAYTTLTAAISSASSSALGELSVGLFADCSSAGLTCDSTGGEGLPGTAEVRYSNATSTAKIIYALLSTADGQEGFVLDLACESTGKACETPSELSCDTTYVSSPFDGMESLPVLPTQGQSEDKNTCLENTHHISSWYQVEVPAYSTLTAAISSASSSALGELSVGLFADCSSAGLTCNSTGGEGLPGTAEVSYSNTTSTAKVIYMLVSTSDGQEGFLLGLTCSGE